MRTLGAAVVAGSLVVTSAFAGTTTLPVGKPAGVHNAQFGDHNAILIISGVGLAALGIALAASSSGGGPTSSTNCVAGIGSCSTSTSTSTTTP